MKLSVRRGKWLHSCALVALFVTGAVQGANAAEPTYQFNIPAESLSQALTDFSQSSSQQIIYTENLVRGRRSGGLHGNYTAEQALNALLAGTGLKVQVNAAGVMMVQSKNVQAASNEAANPESVETVVVTGTHIRGGAVTSPVLTATSADIERSGAATTGEYLRSVPENFAGGQNPTVVQAGGGTQNQNQYSGASTPNLRGLGPESTLTLVDGHRLAFSDNLAAVDVNLIPVSVVNRIDILTDGASAVYGSDAVAGVVNLVLRHDYDGVETRARLGGATEGGAGLQQYDVLGGTNWSKGNTLVAYEYAYQDPILGSQRSYVVSSIGKMTLLPQTQRNSVFADLNQDITDNLSFYAEGLYTERHSNQTTDFGSVVPTLFGVTRATVSQYGISSGLTWTPSAGWTVSLDGDFARNSANDPDALFLHGSGLPVLAQAFSSDLKEGQLSVDGPLVDAPGGPVLLAAGVSYRAEGFSMNQHRASTTFVNISANRNVVSAYGEVDIPVVGETPDRVGLNLLTITIAARYDDYSDAGQSLVPKVGVLYRPSTEFELKANWSKAFRAPSLFNEYQAQTATLGVVADSSSPSGTSTVLSLAGGNRDLNPETANDVSVSLQYQPTWLEGFEAHATYFNIHYSNRIEIPIQGGALTNPLNAPFVTRNPSAAQQSAVLAGATFINNTGAPYNPASVAAIVDNRWLNAEVQNAGGVDILASYAAQDWNFSFNATYLDLNQQISSISPSQQLSGFVFNPPRFRMRAGSTWQPGSLTASLFVNYVAGLTVPSTSGAAAQVDSFTTVDAQLGYDLDRANLIPGFRALLSVENVFDQKPPGIPSSATLIPGLNYDSTNAPALGRFISVQLIKEW